VTAALRTDPAHPVPTGGLWPACAPHRCGPLLERLDGPALQELAHSSAAAILASFVSSVKMVTPIPHPPDGRNGSGVLMLAFGRWTVVILMASCGLSELIRWITMSLCICKRKYSFAASYLTPS
jgi:hypothetical protein